METPKHSRALWIRISWAMVGAGLLWWAAQGDSIISTPDGFGKLRALVLVLGALCVLAGAVLPVKWAGPGLAVLLSTCLSLLAAEGVMRMLFKPRFYTPFVYDAQLLFKLRPGAVRDYQHQPINGGQRVRYEINEQGFRGPALRPIEDGHARVLVYGDSFIHAEYTPLNETFPVQLEAAMVAAGAPKNLEVINAGVAGYGPDQILRRMETELAQFKPRAVVVSIFSGNDFGDLLRSRLYRLDDEGKLQRHEFQVRPEELHQMRVSHEEPILRKMVRNATAALQGRGEAFDRRTYIEKTLDQHVQEYTSYVEQRSPFAGDFAVDPYTADLALLPDNPSSIYRVKLMRQIFARMKTVADEARVPLVLMIVPHPMDLHDGDHETGWVDRAKFTKYDPKRLTGTLETLAAEVGLQAVNLYSPFKAQPEPSAMFLRGGDDHWNSKGQALGARLMAPEVLKAGQLRAP